MKIKKLPTKKVLAFLVHVQATVFSVFTYYGKYLMH
jgi:hypothetical protein